MDHINEIVEHISLKHFNLVGFADVGTPPSIEIYTQWLDRGEHGEMKYLERHLDRKRDPRKLLADARSWIVLACHYDTDEPLSTELTPMLYEEKRGWISRYARGRDYHTTINEKLQSIITELKIQFPNGTFLPCVDTRAVLERDTAQRAGLGWIGKNTCVIDQGLGSFLFIAEILTNLEIRPSKPVPDHCGTCTKCIDACPTQAIVEPRHVDARRCISYWTIENENPPPEILAEKFGYNIFGCDICQDVCPWNKKARRNGQAPKSDVSTLKTFDLRELVNLSVDQIEKIIKNTALERAGGQHLLNNARLALKNLS